MGRYQDGFIGLDDVYRAYRKAKADAFYETSHFHAQAFAKYEKNLRSNLRKLYALIADKKAPWSTNPEFFGPCDFYPKSLGNPDKQKSDGMHFATLNPLEDWRTSCEMSKTVVQASFRQVIVPTVDCQILSALWVIKVGHILDAALDPASTYGNRLRRLGRRKEVVGSLNLDCNGLFAPYFSGYGSWRRSGLEAMRAELEKNNEIYAVTMDVKQFYHRVAPTFLLRKEFLDEIGVSLGPDEYAFTKDFIEGISNWYARIPDYKTRPAGALPVGLSASKIISNVLLVGFDSLIKSKLSPVYYGRYVDDIFLVVRSHKKLRSGVEFMRWLGEKMDPHVEFRNENGAYYLRYRASYALDSEVVFSGEKQKIFHLQGRHGLDLFDQISEQIRKQSSEHRLLPVLAETEGEMLSQALLATPDSSLEPDALRKADTVSVRRLGFSLLVRDVESYARDLKARDWRKPRHTFYGLVERHVLTPRGYFDYFSYIARVFGLMIACGDISAAKNFLKKFDDLCEVLRSTTTAGRADRERFESSIRFYGRAFLQVAIQASTVKGFKFRADFLVLSKRLMRMAAGTSSRQRLDLAQLQRMSRDVLVADLGRRSYREYWYKENRVETGVPAVPTENIVRRVLRLGQIRKFRQAIDLNPPYWPAVAFPTRPLSIAEITAVAPKLLSRPNALKDAIFALRGARVGAGTSPYSAHAGNPPRLCTYVQSVEDKSSYSVAVTSFESTERQWNLALGGAPDRSLERYQKFRDLVNEVLVAKRRPDYVTFPELSVPRRWAFGAAIKFAQNGISMVAGLENNGGSSKYRNDALVSLTTRWPGYRTHMYFVQRKLQPAHHEMVALDVAGGSMSLGDPNLCRPIYVHGDHLFGVLICSDLTAIANRHHFQGYVDTLFVIEWNQDINTFSYLVEAASHDLHAFVVQTNNRAFGDSRVRGPYAKDHRRDVVRVRGGEENYYVIARLEVKKLREFQASFSPVEYEKNKETQEFKPLPIGFEPFGLRVVK